MKINKSKDINTKEKDNNEISSEKVHQKVNTELSEDLAIVIQLKKDIA